MSENDSTPRVEAPSVLWAGNRRPVTVLLRDDRANGTGGVTTIRIGWCSGAWSELRVRRPSSGDAVRTAESVLDRIRILAQQHPDDEVAALLNAEGLQTRQGLAWTFLRVGQVRRVHGIPTACPTMPKGTAARGDGLVPVSVVAAQLGVALSAVGDCCRWGFLSAERKGPHDPLWIRWTEEDRARLDGRRAADQSSRQALDLGRPARLHRCHRRQFVYYL